GASVHPAVTLPRVVSFLSSRWNRPRPPHTPSRLGIVGVQKTANAGFASADADNDLAVDCERGGSDGMTRRVVADLHRPSFGAGSRVEGDEITVQGSDVHGVVEDGDTAIHAWKSEVVDGVANRAIPLPNRPAALQLERH